VRRLIYMVLGVTAILVITASVASGAKPHAVTVRCKPNNITGPPCLAPNLSTSINAKCKKSGTRFALPITASGNAGLRRITVKVGGKTVKVFTFKGKGPLNKKVSVTLSTAGLKHGVYTVKVTVVDTRGKRKSVTKHFAICKPAPVFTG
jgi:hypothetical protein